MNIWVRIKDWYYKEEDALVDLLNAVGSDKLAVLNRGLYNTAMAILAECGPGVYRSTVNDNGDTVWYRSGKS